MAYSHNHDRLEQVSPSTHEEKEFVDKFRASIFEGQKRYQRIDPFNIPLQGPGYYHDEALMQMTTRIEIGVACEMAQSDFNRLVSSAFEGEEHRRFRERHPAAQACYDEYLSMFHLTKQYKA